MRIGIVGAGHAGVEAARVAGQAGAEVTLFSAESVLPYYRPRLVACAFGQADLAAIQIHPREWYEQQKIDLRLNTPVTALDASLLQIIAGDQTFSFDSLIVAAGASPVLPAFARSLEPLVLPLWNIGHARSIHDRVRRGGHLVIIGGGILGIEAALRARDTGMTVEIVELMDHLMPVQFNPRASGVLQQRLMDKGIGLTLGCSVKNASIQANEKIRLELDQYRVVIADFCLVSIGARPDKELAVRAGLAMERGIIVNSSMQTSCAACFAAGDVVQFQGIMRCSVREATAQGAIAGTNCAALLKGDPPGAYRPEPIPLVFRHGDFELAAIGRPGGVDCEEQLLSGSSSSVIRALINKDGVPVGVQMVGTREEFDKYAELVRRAEPDPKIGKE